MHGCILLDFSSWIVLWSTDPRTSRTSTSVTYLWILKHLLDFSVYVQLLFRSFLPDIRSNITLFEGSQTPSACLSGKTTVLKWRWVRSIGGMLPAGEIRSVGKPKFSEEKPVAIPLWSLHNSHGLARYWTRAFVARGRWLTPWAPAQRLKTTVYLIRYKDSVGIAARTLCVSITQTVGEYCAEE